MSITEKYNDYFRASVRKRWTSDEEAEFFQSIETDEKNLYSAVLAEPHLGIPAIRMLQKLFKNSGDEAKSEQKILATLDGIVACHHSNNTKLLRSKIRSVTELFRLMEVPRTWVRQLSSWLESEDYPDTADCLFSMLPAETIVHLKSESFDSWRKNFLDKVRELRQKKNSFINDNAGLVASFVRRFSAGNKFHFSFADLQQEGAFGLMKAMDRFDHKRGYKFATYASWWIRHAVSRMIIDRDKLIRLPVHVHDKYVRIKKFRQEFVEKHGEEPSVEYLSKVTEYPVSVVKELSQPIAVFSLDAKMGTGDDNENDWYSVTEDEAVESPQAETFTREMRNELDSLINKLDPRAQDIIRLRFGLSSSTNEDVTLKTIGDNYGLSRERIRQLECKALEEMKSMLQSRKIYSSDDLVAT